VTSAAGLARPSRRPTWAGRNWTLLTAAAVVTNLGSQGALIAAAFAVLGAGGDRGDVGLAAAARTLPLVMFLLIGGAVADRLPRHRVMVAANALDCVSQAAFAVLVVSDEAGLWQMMLLSALGGTGQAFFNPAAEGMLMSSVRGEQASRAFAMFRMAMQGAGLGGVLVAVIGPGWVLAVDAVAFAVAGALRSFLDVSHIPPREPGRGLFADLRDGWREFVARPWLWAIVAQFSVVAAVVGAADAVYGPLVARDSLGDAGPWGLALGAFGAGTVGGALLMIRWRPRLLLFAGTLCVFPLAAPAAALAVPLPVGPLYAVRFVSGLAIEVFGVSWMTAQHLSECNLLSSRRQPLARGLASLGFVPCQVSHRCAEHPEVVQEGGGGGVVGSEGGLGDGQRPLRQRQGLNVPPQCAKRAGEVAQAGGGGGVVGSEGGLGDGQPPLLQWQGLGVPPQCAVRAGEVVQKGAGVGVVGPEGGLGNGQRPLRQWQGLGVPPQRAKRPGDVAQADGGVGVVGPEGGFGDGQPPLLQRQGLSGLAAGRQIDRSPAQQRSKARERFRTTAVRVHCFHVGQEFLPFRPALHGPGTTRWHRGMQQVQGGFARVVLGERPGPA
jgi:MFS family permease